MKHSFGYCGLDCSQCEAFIATRDNNDGIRKKLANDWSTKEYQLKPEDVQSVAFHR